MEKYYLANLATFHRDGPPSAKSSSSRSGKIKLVDIQYVRRGPSFGVVQLEETLSEERQRGAAGERQISLSILELADNKTATIRPDKQIKLIDNSTSGKIVDFDTSETIFMDAGNQSLQGNKQHPNCILLAENGDISALDLTSDNQKVKRLTSGRENERALTFMQCKLQLTVNEDCYVHSLADRYYVLYKLATHESLELINEYSLADEQPQLELTEMYVMESNPQIVLLELNDSSVRVLHRSVCLYCIQTPESESWSHKSPTESRRHVLLSTNQSQSECLLVSLSQTSVDARRLQVNLDYPSDPDGLLPKGPSFELEDCWKIELNDIESVRALADQEPAFVPSLAIRSCPMWSSNQLNRESCWPKFLLIIYEYHLLVYSFEQPLINPFSLVYDSSFLRFASPEASSAQVDADSSAIKLVKSVKANQENIEVKQRPKLVHNFKLIGAQPTDSLFNTLFLVLGARLQVINQFEQLGVLVAVSQLGHVLAFKFTSSKVNPNKETLYQQLVAQSLAEGSLLRNESTRLEAANKSLEEKLTILERRNLFGTNEFAGEKALGSLLHCQLNACDDDQTDSLYDLSISIPNLLQVSRIVVTSTVGSHLFEPISNAFENCHIDNSVVKSLAQVLKDNIEFLTNIRRSGDEHIWASIEQMLDRQHFKGEEEIQSYALLDLAEYSNRYSAPASDYNFKLRLAMLNGQAGHIKVFYLFSKPPKSSEEQNFERSLLGDLAGQHEPDFDQDQAEEQAQVFHMKSIKIKPLMSYKLKPGEMMKDTGTSTNGRLRISGQFKPSTIVGWLDESFHLRSSDGSNLSIFKGKFYSRSTRCHINFDIHEEGDHLELISDDLIALELIKKHLLKLATDAQVKLDIDESVPSIRQIHLLLDLQLENLSTIDKRISSWSKSVQLIPNIGDQVDLLMDTLTSEVITVADEDAPDWLLESLREDIKMMLMSKEAAHE